MTVIEHCRYMDGIRAALKRLERDLPHARRDNSVHLSGLLVACSILEYMLKEAETVSPASACPKCGHVSDGTEPGHLCRGTVQ